MLASPSIHRCSTVTGYGHSSFLTKYLSRKKKYVCQACRVGYRKKDSLNNHIKKKHGGDKSSFQETGFLVQDNSSGGQEGRLVCKLNNQTVTNVVNTRRCSPVRLVADPPLLNPPLC